MKGFFLLAALALAGLGSGCGPRVAVVFDEAQDFGTYRSWEWLPEAPRRVEAPLDDPPTLEVRLVRLVERGLSARGLERAGGEGADLLVSAYLGVQRQIEYVNETRAVQSLHSLHNTPSYEVQATTHDVRSYDEGYLVIALTDASEGRLVWSGEFRGRYRGVFWPHLGEAVSRLLQHFPPERASTRDAGDPPLNPAGS